MDSDGVHVCFIVVHGKCHSLFFFFNFTNEHNRVSFSEHEIKAAVFARRQKYMKVCVNSIICGISLNQH